jgi:heat shock protein HslJ
VLSYNNGKGGVTSLIIGTEITANFGEDGLLAGNAGCNGYSADYETDGNNISIGPAVSTEMACLDIEGVMEQEQRYLAALGTAASYKIDGLNMEMRTADGALVATFQRDTSQ